MRLSESLRGDRTATHVEVLQRSGRALCGGWVRTCFRLWTHALSADDTPSCWRAGETRYVNPGSIPSWSVARWPCALTTTTTSAARPREGATRLLRLGRRTVVCSVEHHPQRSFEGEDWRCCWRLSRALITRQSVVCVQGQGGLCPGVNLKKVVMLGLTILSVRSLLLVRCGHTHVRVAG
jgi:hypothetical protein